MATLCSAATTGLLEFSITAITDSRCGSCADLSVPNSLMSAPPEKALPAPVMTMALTAASASARSRPATRPPRGGRAGEGGGGAGDDHGAEGGVGIGPQQAVDKALAGGQPQSVDGGVGHGDHGDAAVDLVISAHAVLPCRVKKNGRAFLL